MGNGSTVEGAYELTRQVPYFFKVIGDGGGGGLINTEIQGIALSSERRFML